MKKSKINWKINHQIRASELRVISSEGKQLGVMSLQDALKHAEIEGFDLVEIAPMAKPPVAKITELGKLKYLEDKKARKEKKGSKAGELKEIRFTPFIGPHDYNVRLERINEFLDDRNKIRVAVVFKGRQLGSKQFGYDLLQKLLTDLKPRVKVDMEPKFLGKHLIMSISATSSSKKASDDVKS
ncbi:MAG TPA: translation initiation factor IF-3 [Patescibacteria group bacterium]|nr:translation initiation factor IF-3 [Patescibacteria group bacterium]